MPAFAQYIGIDYSGAQTPTTSLKGLRVNMAEGDAAPVEVPPPPSPGKFWTRRGVAVSLYKRAEKSWQISRMYPNLRRTSPYPVGFKGL